MKQKVKGRFPKIFALLRRIYHHSYLFRNKIASSEKVKIDLLHQRAARENQIIEDIFDGKYEVHNGPFAGMKYINGSVGSALLPKLLGSYEEPIHPWIREIIESKKYHQILDIGCAEGYYACGFAVALPNAQIFAYDISESARKSTSELANLNRVSNIEIKAECSHQELDLRSKQNTLVFCDIEGFEHILLDPKRVPNLKFVDILVESHDCFIDGVSDQLIERFGETHKLRIVVDYPFRTGKYVTPVPMTVKEARVIMNEYRSRFMKFIFMESVIG